MTSRTVRFYKILDEQERPFTDDIPFIDLLEQVRSMSDDDCYVKLSRMEVLGTSYEPPTGKKPAVPLLVLDRITREVTLRIEQRRNHRPLQLAEDETLAEPTYYSIFPNNVVGVMRNNGSAPGPTSLRDYLNQGGFLGDVKVSIVPLADSNAARRLSDVDVISRIHLKVDPSVSAQLVGRPSLWGIIQGTRQQAGLIGIEMTLRFDRRTQDTAEAIKDELLAMDETDQVTMLDKAQIAYKRLEDGRADTYDFLHEAVAESVEVVLGDANHAPTERSAAEAMAAAYTELFDEIRRADGHF